MTSVLLRGDLVVSAIVPNGTSRQYCASSACSQLEFRMLASPRDESCVCRGISLLSEALESGKERVLASWRDVFTRWLVPRVVSGRRW